MRFSNLAACTLTVLMAGEMAAQAETPVTPEPLPEGESAAIAPRPELSEAAASEAIAPIAAPQTLALEADLPVAFGDRPQVSALAEASPVALASEEGATALEPAAAPETNPGEILAAEAVAPEPMVLAEQPAQAEAAEGAIAPKSATCATQKTKSLEEAKAGEPYQLAQAIAQAGSDRCPRPTPIAEVEAPEPFEAFAASPAMSIAIPVGYGADDNTLFLTGSYQPTVREDDGSVGAAGIGIGLGDADKAVGLELSYALAANDNFGEGGFNAKLHRRFAGDVGAAVGWNGFLNVGRNDFEHSLYGAVTKVFRTQESLRDPFSRVALTVGVGSNQFRSNGAVEAGDNNINVFGNLAVRVVRPVSFITEWTGQDLALGLSIAPFKNIPLTITPALRDVAGAGDGARFVVGTGMAFKF